LKIDDIPRGPTGLVLPKSTLSKALKSFNRAGNLCRLACAWSHPSMAMLPS
jgi:hypothetical protein